MIWLLIFSITVAIVLYNLSRRHRYFAKIGLPGPPTKFITGNTFDMFRHGSAPMLFRDWTKKYGKTYGYYEGKKRVIVTSDLAVLNDICVKQFAHFHGRKVNSMGRDPDTEPNLHMFNARGLRWKRLRTLAAPTFTVNSLRDICPMVDRACKIMVQRVTDDVKSGTDEGVNIYEYYQELTLDVIAQVAFGDDRGLQGNPDNPYLDACRKIFRPEQHRANKINRGLFFFGDLFPIFKEPLWFLINRVSTYTVHPFYYLRALIGKSIDERKAALQRGNRGRQDFLQMFIEAEIEPTQVTEDKEALGLVNGQKSLKLSSIEVAKNMTHGEIVENLALFLIAGYDTTSNTLGYTSYLLATNPDVQDKALREIDEHKLNDKTDLTYDDMHSLEYLDWVMKETLRLYPLASIAVMRESQAPVSIAKVGQLDAGIAFHADLWSLHHDKEVWGEDAEDFRPERFSPEESKGRHPLAWMPFGAGPRQCIGIRLAVMEYKMALVRLLAHHRLVKCSKTTIPLEYGGMSIIAPKEVTLKVEKRN